MPIGVAGLAGGALGAESSIEWTLGVMLATVLGLSLHSRGEAICNQATTTESLDCLELTIARHVEVNRPGNHAAVMLGRHRLMERRSQRSS